MVLLKKKKRDERASNKSKGRIVTPDELDDEDEEEIAASADAIAPGGKKWFLRGKEAEERGDRHDEERKAASIMRLWLPAEASAKCVFLDTEGFQLYEHSVYLNGSWNNFFTCHQEFDNCVLCLEGLNPALVMAYTIIDLRKIKSKKTPGKIIQNQKKLLVLKRKAFNKLKKRRDSEQVGGDLTYAVFELSRDSAEEANTGESFDFIGRVSVKDLLKLAPPECKTLEQKKEWLKPVDYMKYFAPKTADYLRRIVKAHPAIGSAEDATTGAGDDELPFDLGGTDIEKVL